MTAHTVVAARLREIADFIALLPDDIETPEIESTGVTFYLWDLAPHAAAPFAQERAQRITEVLGGAWADDSSGLDKQFVRFRCAYDLAGKPVRIVGYRDQLTLPALVEAAAS